MIRKIFIFLLLPALLCAQTGISIKSGASTDLLTVHPTSKASRVTPYDDAGNSLAPIELARGMANILVRQTATTAAGACTFGIRNASATRTVYIVRIAYTMSFDGTGAATLMRYEWVKGTSVCL